MTEATFPIQVTDATGSYTIQVHSFRTQARVDRVVSHYRRRGYQAFSTAQRGSEEEPRWRRIFIGRFATKTDADPSLSASLKLFAAAHGILSLLMLIGLIVMFILAVADEKSGRPGWFRRRPALTYAFLGLWMISVASGEAFFVMRYLV